MPWREWLSEYQALLGAAFGLSVALFLGSLVAMPVAIARMRSDYFVSRTPTEESWSGRHRVVRAIILTVKNLVGVLLVVAGLGMLVLPGQGLIAIVIGLSLLNFPGKRRLELRLVRQRPVLSAINWIRARAKRPPLQIPERDEDS